MTATTSLAAATAAGPLAGADVWQAVLDRAGHRCECTSCPTHRRKSADGRCHNEHRPDTKLIAGPKDPGPDPARMPSTLDPGDMVAWCLPCWDHAVAVARKHARNAARLAALDNDDTLF